MSAWIQSALSVDRECVDVGILTVIPTEFRAVCAVLGLDADARDKHPDGSVIYRGHVASALTKRDYAVVVGCIGYAGNSDAASATTALLKNHGPRVAFLVGIAAGIRGKTHIGEALFSERVVAYEPAALVRRADGTSAEEARPDIERLDHGLRQDLVDYLARDQGRDLRLRERFVTAGAARPTPPAGQEQDYAAHVAAEVTVRDATIASGEKLLRDPSKLKTVRELHGKVEAGEMEAAGFVTACGRADIPWLVVRGISDFGDELKHDGFHALAAGSAAAALADFLAHGLDLGGAPATPAPSTPSPFIVGMPIERDEDFFGREAQKTALLDAMQRGQPMQILGERRMGKSSLLRWAQRHVPQGRQVVRVDAQSLPEKSPAELVRQMARALGRDDLIESHQVTPGASNGHAARALLGLMPLILLVDEADALAGPGHGFAPDFLGVLRALGQARRLLWVSASRRDLRTLFLESGLGSDFLNDSQTVWVGQLEADAAAALVRRGSREHVALAVEAAAGFACSLQTLGAALRIHAPQAAVDRTVSAMLPYFRTWWQRLSAAERALLLACTGRPLPIPGLPDQTRRLGRNVLVERGLLVERDGAFALPGSLWGEFVAAQASTSPLT